MSFTTSISGLDAAQERMAVISNNIVNAGTVGCKKGEAQFGDRYSSALQDTGAAAGTGSNDRIRSDFTQGEFQFTSSALDLAIDGSGLFLLRAADGTNEYTRAGSFQSDNNGFIVSDSGLRVQGYQADANGRILPNLGDLRVDTGLLNQKQTGNVNFAGNIDSRVGIPENAFSIDDPTSFNSTSTTTIYDRPVTRKSLRFTSHVIQLLQRLLLFTPQLMMRSYLARLISFLMRPAFWLQTLPPSWQSSVISLKTHYQWTLLSISQVSITSVHRAPPWTSHRMVTLRASSCPSLLMTLED